MNKKQKIVLLLFFLAAGGTIYAFSGKKNQKHNSANNANTLPPREADTDFSKRIDNAITNNETIVAISLQEITQQIYEELSKANSNGRVILALLENIDEQQFRKIIELFGHRDYSTITLQNKGDVLVKYPLPFWLKHDLPERYYKQLKQKYPNSL